MKMDVFIQLVLPIKIASRKLSYFKEELFLFQFQFATKYLQKKYIMLFYV
jgi:hypothetical protein